ncbi:MAG: SPFH domain-containing protein [Flavobacteriales bacterium]|nr:SPFH domain-containing protein [Flavobacteriales bacterium]
MTSKEKNIRPGSGYLGLLYTAICTAIAVFLIVSMRSPLAIAPIVLIFLLMPGFFIVNPNSSKVLVLFGKYIGTVRENGFYFANPFYTKHKISLRARNFDSERVKVNDKLGNPILISVILVWKVEDTFKAAFEVDDYANFVRVQTDAAVRKMAGLYSYDNFDDEQQEVTLRSGLHEVNEALEDELRERLDIAGIDVLEARIGYLAYAPEIANAMLRRQQAVAIVAAREKIVEGAVGMVDMALELLGKKQIVELDEEKKATMVSNLMVVLCGDKDASPVINTGTLHQ